MSMDLFRRNQKLVFWIVTIIIVPSFILVWGVSDIGRGGVNDTADFEIGVVDNKVIKYPEFESFQRRIRAATGNLPLQFPNIPGVDTPQEEFYKFLSLYSLLKDSEKAGIVVSDLQVGTYIERLHPVIRLAINPTDPQSRERAVDNFCRQMKITRAEFLRGVREWQGIVNYIEVDSNLLVPNKETAYSFYALNNAECVVKRIRFLESDAIRQQAKDEIMAKPKEELEDGARIYIAENSANPRYREPALWRFDWVLIPFVPENSVQQPTENEIRERYEAAKGTTYQGKSFDEAKDEVKNSLIQEEVDRQTLRNFTVDVDAQLRGPGVGMEASELVKLTPLVKYGAVAGNTGDEALAAAEIAARLPEGTEYNMARLLNDIDGDQNTVMRQGMIDEWKNNFGLITRPFKSEKGYFRVRLKEYQPSSAAEIDTEDGAIKPEYYELALADIVGERTAEIVREQALEMEEKVRAHLRALEEGEEVPDPEMEREYDSMPTDVLAYSALSGPEFEIGRLPVGELLGPLPYADPQTNEQGQELVIMVQRLAPTWENFLEQPEQTQLQYRNQVAREFQGGTGFSYGIYGPTVIVQPGATVLGELLSRMYSGELRVSQSLLDVQ